jgi:hypothetical protein
MTARIVLIALATVLFLQAGWTVRKFTTTAKLVDIEIGERIPFSLPSEARDLLQASDGAESPPCRAVFLCTVRCAGCAAMADRHSSLIQDIPETERPIWLVAADEEAVSAWAKDHGLPQSLVFPIRQLPRSGLTTRPSYGNLWFTPLRVMLDYDETVLDVWPANTIPSSDERLRLCTTT